MHDNTDLKVMIPKKFYSFFILLNLIVVDTKQTNKISRTSFYWTKPLWRDSPSSVTRDSPKNPFVPRGITTTRAASTLMARNVQ